MFFLFKIIKNDGELHFTTNKFVFSIIKYIKKITFAQHISVENEHNHFVKQIVLQMLMIFNNPMNCSKIINNFSFKERTGFA